MARKGSYPTHEFTVVGDNVIVYNKDGTSDTYLNDPYRAERYRELFDKYKRKAESIKAKKGSKHFSLKEILKKYIRIG